jgi:diadenosine tetraphosphate (Ap4A) HIT family hydrolase
MTNLTMEERLQLMREIALCEEAMVETFYPVQTNVAAIGNKELQLYVHIVCRSEKDKHWPDTVWSHKPEHYKEAKKEEMISKIKKAIMIKMADGRYMQY